VLSDSQVNHLPKSSGNHCQIIRRTWTGPDGSVKVPPEPFGSYPPWRLNGRRLTMSAFRILHHVLLVFCVFILGVGSVQAQLPPPNILYSFGDQPDGELPYAGLVQDANGNLYGTTQQGGASGNGTVFKLDPNGNETVLHSFTGADGALPIAPLIMDSSGNLYGTTLGGGANNSGTIFKVDASGQYTVLHTFTGSNGSGDGSFPWSPLVQDAAGNLYGTTNQGGASDGGTVFKLDPSGNETILHSFTGVDDGVNPYSGLIRDSAGNLFGTAREGGGNIFGAVYKLDSSGNETVLYGFKGPPNDGSYPQTGLVRDSAGNLYGTTSEGGNGPCGPDPTKPIGCGTVFKLDPNGKETVLFSFQDLGPRGSSDRPSGLLLDNSGVLYGTTGTGNGTIFAISSAGNEIVLHSFTGTNGDGAFPQASLIFDAEGNLLGTTAEGGASGVGTVFKQILPDFTLAPASTNLTVAFGGQVTDTLSFASQKADFQDAIQLSCSVTGPTPLATCGMNPASVTPGSAGATSTLTITAPATAIRTASSSSTAWRFLAAWLPLAALGMVLGSGPRVRRRYWLLGICLPLLLLLPACGGGGNAAKGPANYTVTVTAAAPLAVHTVQVSVTVR
jgi:uncharacterized repeat protein (TIGR03803 family)